MIRRRKWYYFTIFLFVFLSWCPFLYFVCDDLHSVAFVDYYPDVTPAREQMRGPATDWPDFFPNVRWYARVCYHALNDSLGSAVIPLIVTFYAAAIAFRARKKTTYQMEMASFYWALWLFMLPSVGLLFILIRYACIGAARAHLDDVSPVPYVDILIVLNCIMWLVGACALTYILLIYGLTRILNKAGLLTTD